ncbi:Endoplasmic reticulum metallopeptidase 1 [Rhizoclosmatium hyalinum]|nr:Endoplasmic reticulum metallopeptidase 1 [Rhizoclosmatium hyalinum]
MSQQPTQPPPLVGVAAQAAVRRRGRPIEKKPKQTGSILALFFLLLITSGVVYMRSLQGALPSPYPSPHDSQKKDTVDISELIVTRITERIWGPPKHMPKFDARVAQLHLEEILKFGPRPFSSKANFQTADEIVAMLHEWKDGTKNGNKRLYIERDQKSVLAGPFDFPRQAQNKTYSLALDNIIVKLRGICEFRGGKECPSLLVSAHYDAVVGSPGASDDGIAVAVILEMIRLLSTDEENPLPYSIIFVLNNCEECGLLGARHFTKHKFYKSVRASINLEGGGRAGPAMLYRGSDYTMLKTYADSVLQPYSSVIGNDVMNLGMGDGKNEEKAAAPIKTDDKLRNRKAGTADATSAEGEVAEVKKEEPPKKKRSNLPNWFPVFGAATVMPVVSTLHTINQLLMGIEPTIIDGTPALGVIGLVTLFASILVVSLLPYVLTAPNTIARTSQLSLFVLGLASLLLLNQLYEPLTIPSDVAPFDREHPLKIIPKMEMDVTDVNNPKTTYDLTFNTLALPYLVPTVLKPKSTKCSAVNKVTTKCSIDPIPNKIHGPRFPELAKALDVVEFQEIGKSTWSVTVRSEYSRICFFGGVEGDDNAWRLNEKGGIYPYNVWPGTNSVRPSKFDSRVGTAFAYKSYFDEPQTFTVKVNRTRIDELGASAKLLTMKVGCYVDDLAYIPGWDSLEKAVLPKWTVLEGSGNGVLTVSKKFVLIL